eukprot:TRINITY_DN41517_c0_g1_i1.p1 TRINITY_DN41517_c0_g1~~TRINITY_DN41517_c0_g1_i1.p1  ORF type:complete len:815 (-),score=158.71 TRINITY_DN41517_c0_g1_i1:230-2674(-)
MPPIGSPPSSVTVCIRLRPFLARERPPAVVEVNGNTVRIQVDVDQLYGAPEVERRQFVFDSCLGQEVGQTEMYALLGDPVLQSVLAGFSGTLFAYGQTGSGKSYSMMGSESRPGLIPQLGAELFKVVDNDQREAPAKEMRIAMSFLEIYNEELKDLLDPRPRQKKLYVHNHPKLGVYVPHLTEAATASVADLIRLLDFGTKIRATAQTNMNSTSSRSHSVLTLRVTQVLQNGKLRSSSINLCDLAGSERAKKTGAQGKRLREGQCINNSLSVLGQVISKLAAGGDKRKGVHVPFRQSKLTHLLMDALSGNSVTTMLANVSPAHSEAEESLSTLRFAESVKKVTTNPQLSELAPEEPELILESFRSEIGVLEEALKKDATLIPQLNRAIEASQHLVETFSKRTGTAWAQAVEQTRALEAVQKELLEDMRLPMQEVGQLAGVDEGTPYLLNISDDPALSGCLLYFLRAEPEISTVGQAGPQSIAANSIVLSGLGIPARLCELRYRPVVAEVEGGGGSAGGQQYVSVTKVCKDSDGRLLVNGRPLAAGMETEISHGDRLVFGWAFCFRLIAMNANSQSAGDSSVKHGWEAGGFENVTKEVQEHSMTCTMSGMDMIRAASQWQSDFSKRSGGSTEAADNIMNLVGELMVLVEEANALCAELQKAVPGMVAISFDIGFSFSFLAPQRLPSVVVQVWKRPESQLLAAWPGTDFERHLAALRDAHREVLKSGGALPPRWAWRLGSEEWWGGQARPESAAPAKAAPTGIGGLDMACDAVSTGADGFPCLPRDGNDGQDDDVDDEGMILGDLALESMTNPPTV